MSRRFAVSLLAALAVLVVPASAPAKVNVAVGIGDQSSRMFGSPLYESLALKRTRYFIEWNAIDQQGELAKALAFVNAARASGVTTLMHISTDDINSVPRRKLPSVRAYRSKVRALYKVFRPLGVKEWGVWNEANHKTQPTAKNPKRAAQFFTTLRSFCKGCTIVALDVLDQSGVETYIKRWFRALGRNRTKAKVIGIHNYSEVNRKLGERRSRSSLRKYPGTKRIIDAGRKGNRRVKFWYTETGGLVNFGRAFPCSESRAASRTKYMFTLAKRYRRHVTRLYTYNWFGADCIGFDAGLVDADGTARTAYAVFKSRLKGFTK